MKNKSKEVLALEERAREIRRLIIRMLSIAKSGHPGGSLSSTEIMTCLYFSVMRHDPKNPEWPERDRFHLSKGHCCPVLYAALAESGYFPHKELWNLRQLGAMLQGHPDRRTPGIDVASGSLGQGLSVALGVSLASQIDAKEIRVYCLLGDGETQEGNIWEAAMAASHYKCDHLCAILDYNNFQIDGKVSDILAIEPLEAKWQAFGWHVIGVDGHDVGELLGAFAKAKTIKGKPTIIIARTTKGKGVSFMENVADFHGRAPTEEETKIALKELGGSDA